MKERRRLDFAAVGFRLRGHTLLKAQMNEIKYGGNRRLAWRWGRWLGNHVPCPKTDGGRVILVPVPLHWRKQMQRGYNQAEWIARGLGSAWGLKVVPRALKRVRHEASLTHLSRSSRAEMTRELYAVHRREFQHDDEVIVVDDVMTTGATLSACGAAIRNAGGRWRGAAVLALA